MLERLATKKGVPISELQGKVGVLNCTVYQMPMHNAPECAATLRKANATRDDNLMSEPLVQGHYGMSDGIEPSHLKNKASHNVASQQRFKCQICDEEPFASSLIAFVMHKVNF